MLALRHSPSIIRSPGRVPHSSMKPMQLLEGCDRIRTLALPDAHINDVEVIPAGPYGATLSAAMA